MDELKFQHEEEGTPGGAIVTFGIATYGEGEAGEPGVDIEIVSYDSTDELENSPAEDLDTLGTSLTAAEARQAGEYLIKCADLLEGKGEQNALAPA